MREHFKLRNIKCGCCHGCDKQCFILEHFEVFHVLNFKPCVMMLVYFVKSDSHIFQMWL